MKMAFIGLLFFILALVFLASTPKINNWLYTPLRGTEKWAKNSVERARELGLIPHYLLKRNAYKLVNGEEMLGIFYEVFRHLAIERKPDNGFTVINELVDDDSRIMTRADLAFLIVKMANQFRVELVGVPGAFEDVSGHPLVEYIDCVSCVGIMTSVENGQFKPSSGLTLQDTVVAAERFTTYAKIQFRENHP